MLLAAPAREADAPTPATVPSGEPWQFQLTFYSWLTSISGDLGVRCLPTFPVDASFGDLISHLEGILPVAFVAKKDEWTLLFDFYWADLGADSALPGPALTQADVGMRQTIASVVFGYRLRQGPLPPKAQGREAAASCR